MRAERRFRLVVAAADGVSQAERVPGEVFDRLAGLDLGWCQVWIGALLATLAGFVERGDRRLSSSAVVFDYAIPADRLAFIALGAILW